MEVVISFFSGLADMVLTPFRWLASLIEDIAYIAKLLVKALAAIPSYFSWIPDDALAILLVIFGIVAIYKLAGREG